MAVSLDVLKGPRLKIKRANRHIDELLRLSQPLSEKFYTIEMIESLVPRNAALANPQLVVKYAIQFRSLEPIPETFALIIGDAIHNLRAALDHLATGIVRGINWKTPDVCFPMRKHRKDLIASDGTPVDDLATIELALPGSIHLLLDKIRPEDGSNEFLWAFHGLDNDDKHNLLTPTITLIGVSWEELALPGMGCTIKGGMSAFDVANPKECVLHTSVGNPFTVYKHTNVTVEVKFGKRTVFEDEPVIPTLRQLSALVADTLDQFETLIRNSN